MPPRIYTRQQCTAHSKQSKERCRKWAVNGRGVCHMHGGNTPIGTAAVAYKHGRYSKSLPGRLAQRYEEARKHPALLSLRDDLAVSEARLEELFGRLGAGETGDLWQQLRAAMEQFSLAMAAGNAQGMQKHFGTVSSLVTQGASEAEAWQEILAVWETRCKLVQTEHKTLLAMNQMVTAEQLMLHMGVITHVIQRTVEAYADAASARRILGSLSAEFHAISVQEAGGGLGPRP